MGKEEAIIFKKAFDFDELPESLQNASDYIKELVQRTGRLINIYFQEECAQERTNGKLIIEKSPELKYFIKVGKKKQLIFGGDYKIFDKLF